jgi:hypothetical protein
LIAKFRANSEAVIDTARQDEIIEATWGFEKISDVGEYMKLLVSQK